METYAVYLPATNNSPARDLPMRDGNFTRGGDSYSLRPARDLPMRDGNNEREDKRLASLIARDLPMRDGN